MAESREERADQYAWLHGDSQTRRDFLAGWDAAIAQGEPSDAQIGTRGELLSLVKSLDYGNLSLLSGMTQSELGDRNMRARAANGEDGSGW